MNARQIKQLAASLYLLALPAWAADPEFRLVSTTIDIPERGSVTGFTLLSATGKFEFQPPPGARVFADPKQRRVTIVGLGVHAKLSFF